jgi:hypothetical protein
MSYVYHTLIGTFDGMSQANVAGFLILILMYRILQLVCRMKRLFLCDLFNIEYVHFIERNQRN